MPNHYKEPYNVTMVKRLCARIARFNKNYIDNLKGALPGFAPFISEDCDRDFIKTQIFSACEQSGMLNIEEERHIHRIVDNFIDNVVSAEEESKPKQKQKPNGNGHATEGLNKKYDTEPLSKDPVIAELNKQYALTLVGDKSTIMKPGDDIEFLTLPAFRDWFANKFVKYNGENITQAKYWMQHPDRREYSGLVFDPKQQPHSRINGKYNLWCGFTVQPKPGDCSNFLHHIKINVCRGSDDLYPWVVGWFAQIFQQPTLKLGTSVVLRGKQGTGKGKVAEVIGKLLGAHFKSVSDPHLLFGRFNMHLTAVLLINPNEAFWAGDYAAEGKLKDMVTGDWMFLEPKGKDVFQVRSYMRLLVSGNEDWIVPAAFEERRFAVLDMGEEHMQDRPYFAAIDDQMDNGGWEALLDYLLKFDISKVDLRQIPKTKALFEQKVSSFNPEQGWLYDLLSRGELPFGCGEHDRCPTEALFINYIEHAARQGARRRKLETQFGIFLRKYLPDIEKKKSNYQLIEKGQTYEKYGSLYVFPPLTKCRAAFAAMVGHEDTLVWDDKEEWTINKAPNLKVYA